MTTTTSIPTSATLIDIEAHYLKLSNQWLPLKENTAGGFNVQCPWCFKYTTFFVATGKTNLLFKCFHSKCITKGKCKGASKYIKKVCPRPFWDEFVLACSPHWNKIWGNDKITAELEDGEPSRYPSLFDNKEQA